jgi:hypothetical protein
MPKPIRKYYERNNFLIQNYMYIDRLLDSSLPHNLIQEYHQPNGSPIPCSMPSQQPNVPATISEESPHGTGATTPEANGSMPKFKRTPKDIYRVRDSETTPLLSKDDNGNDEDLEQLALPPALEPEEEAGSQSRIVTIAIYLNFVANSVLLIMKIIVVALSSSVSVLASLVDAALDFLSTVSQTDSNVWDTC